jgi:hypothetical protein
MHSGIPTPQQASQSSFRIFPNQSLQNTFLTSPIYLMILVRWNPETFYRSALIYRVEDISSESCNLSFDEETEDQETEDQDSVSLHMLNEPDSPYTEPDLFSEWEEDSDESGGVPLPSSAGNDLVADDEHLQNHALC